MRCGAVLFPNGLCSNHCCSTNRPTNRPGSSQPSKDDPDVEHATSARLMCPICLGAMPDNVRYCPHCHAPYRPSATPAYHDLQSAALKPPRLPAIEEDSEHPPSHSGTRRKK